MRVMEAQLRKFPLHCLLHWCDCRLSESRQKQTAVIVVAFVTVEIAIIVDAIVIGGIGNAIIIKIRIIRIGFNVKLMIA